MSPNLGLSATLNPIEGDFIENEDGTVSMITDQPLSADHLGVALTVKLPGLAAQTFNVPLSELNDTLENFPLLGPLLGTTDLAQSLLDTTVVTVDEFDSDGSMTLDEGDYVVCYLAGTMIMTDKGPVAIENLREGQLVVCRFGSLRPILWIGRQHFTEARADGQEAIRFAPGSLGHNTPREPLFVSSGHSMLVGDILVLAEDLINGITVTREAPRHAWSYYQLDLGCHDLLLANGAWSESFADCEDFRSKFDNHGEFARRHPDHVAPPEPALCAERPRAGAAYHAALRMVAERALALSADLAPGQLSGRIETITSSRHVAGWAVDHDHPARPVLLEVMLDGSILGTTIACIREDGTSKLHFMFDAGRELTTGEQLRLVVRRAQDGTALAPLSNGIVGELEGHLDLITDDGLLEGWARDPANPDQPVPLEIVIGDEVVGTVLASRDRRDLLKAGLGSVAFSFELGRTLSAEEMRTLGLRSASGHAALCRSEETSMVFRMQTALEAA